MTVVAATRPPATAAAGRETDVPTPDERRLWQECDHLRFFLRYRARLAQTEAADTPDMAYPARSGPDPDATPGAPGYRTTAPWVPAAERRADTDLRQQRDVERGDPYAIYPAAYWRGWERALREATTAMQAHCLTRYLLDGQPARIVAEELGWHDQSRVTYHVNRGLRLMALWLRAYRKSGSSGKQAAS